MTAPRTPEQVLISILLRYVLPIAAIGGGLWFAYDAVYDRGYAACQTEAKDAADKAEERNDQAASEAGADLNKSLGQTLPRVETNAYESAERIRTVYVDRPVPAGCAWDGRVLEELEGGREAANRAVRSGAGGADSADPEKP